MLAGTVEVVEHRHQAGQHREHSVLLDELAVPVDTSLVVDVLGLQPLEVVGEPGHRRLGGGQVTHEIGLGLLDRSRPRPRIRLAVAPLHRSGGQAQFIVRNRPTAIGIAERTGLDDVLAWIEHEAHHDLALGDIAARAAVSVRTLNRHFAAETGQTPMQWLAGVRVRHAQQLLETTSLGVERVGSEVGFASPANFREQFRRLTGVSPQSYRNTFRERVAG